MCVVGVAWLRRGAAGMAGLVKRPAAPGGGLRDRRGRGRGSWMRGESRRALVFGDECMMSTCIVSVSSSHPAPPPTTCTTTGSRGASPSSSSRAARRTGQGGTQGRSRKAPVRAQGRLPAFCAHRSVPATLAVGQDNRPISPGVPPHEVPPIISS